jgi:thiosulfate reductase cytochrome b subunit
MSDWTTDAANAIDNAVGLVRERTVEPVQSIARVVVLGVLAALILIPAVTMLVIAAFRLLTIAAGGRVWIAWAGLGGIFVLGGWFCWSKRNP